MILSRPIHSTTDPDPIDLGSIPLVGPDSGLPLRRDRAWSLSDGRTRWPVVAGVPFLRINRDSLRIEALEALDAGDERRALTLLLADQDDYARIAPPDPSILGDLIEAVDSGRATLRGAMDWLRFGPVADYFAFRWSSPTYLSGLALLDRFGGDPDSGPVIEVACGVGHYLRDLALRGRSCVGVDVVFSKLWLARKFVVPSGVPLVCGDVTAGFPVGPIPGGAVAFCHDAFYFLPEKPKVVAGLQTLVGDRGRVVIGHAHNRDFDHGGVAGEPRTPGEYASLLPGCTLFDDAELARSAWSSIEAPERSVGDLARVEAVAMVWSASGWDHVPTSNPRSLLDPVPGASLRINPVLVEEGGALGPRWPSARFEAEYAAGSSYLVGEPVPSPETLGAAANGAGGRGSDPELDRLARRRILLDLPERW